MSEARYTTALGLHGEPTIVVRGEKFGNRKTIAIFENSERGFELATDACDRWNNALTANKGRTRA